MNLKKTKEHGQRCLQKSNRSDRNSRARRHLSRFQAHFPHCCLRPPLGMRECHGSNERGRTCDPVGVTTIKNPLQSGTKISGLGILLNLHIPNSFLA